MENLTSIEDEAISKLRNLLENDLPVEKLEDKTFLYQFLKARNFNVSQAESMLRRNIRWRKEMQVDSIATDFKSTKVLRKYASQNFLGFDKEGSPVVYNAVGNMDTIGLFKSANSLNLLRHIIRDIETNCRILKEQSIKLGRPVTQIVVIYDMKNLTLAKATHSKSVQSFRDGMTIFQDNYPELLKRFFIINAATYFTIVFPVIKVVLANAVLNKVQVYGKDGWKEDLLKVIDANVLPEFLGGSLTETNKNTDISTVHNLGGPIPESFHLVKNIENMAQREGSKFLRIDRRDSVEISVSVQKPKSVLHWEFEVKNYDIGFGLTLDSSKESPIELIPVHKIETELEPECGLFRCETAGDYRIVFDNSFSWFHSKELYYRTWVTNAEDNQYCI